MKVVNGYKTETNPSALNYGDDDKFVMALTPAEINAIKESRANAEIFNEVMKDRYKVADEVIKETAKLGPDEPEVNKLKLNEDWFKDYPM